MRTSAPFRSASLCQRYSASWANSSFAAWKAYSSQLLPGKTTMPNFMSVDLYAIALDHRVREHLVGHFGRELPRGAGFVGGQVELEIFSLADIADLRIAQRMQRLGDRPPLRIEHRWLERHKHAGTHAIKPSPGERPGRRCDPRASTARRARRRARSPAPTA